MLRVSGTAREVDVMRHFLGRLSFQLRDEMPAALRDVEFAVIEPHSTAFDGTALVDAMPVVDDRLMTYTEAASALDCSTDTVGRRVAEGRLVKVGRRVTADSVLRLMRGAA